MVFDHLVASLSGTKIKPAYGNRFSRLTVISYVPCYDRWGSKNWHCRCDCGGTNVVREAMLINGRIKSCGCLRKELAYERLPAARRAHDLGLALRGSDGKFISGYNRS